MNRPRTHVALIASFSLICSGCCLVQTRKDTGGPYVLPVRQWTWYEWSCVVIVGCVLYLITRNESDSELMVTPPRDECGDNRVSFPAC